VSFYINSDLLILIDTLRGDIPRSRFIIRLLEDRLKSSNCTQSKKRKNIPVESTLDTMNQQVSVIRGKD
ncbi:MAG: hypothetical protein L0H53_09370, partial [Candidatus Nitrosocosmicus sp.]|nr:hypothetical protein [Candidatus Nitrosocosmicus sp.]